eukprot:RCo006877
MADGAAQGKQPVVRHGVLQEEDVLPNGHAFTKLGPPLVNDGPNPTLDDPLDDPSRETLRVIHHNGAKPDVQRRWPTLQKLHQPRHLSFRVEAGAQVKEPEPYHVDVGAPVGGLGHQAWRHTVGMRDAQVVDQSCSILAQWKPQYLRAQAVDLRATAQPHHSVHDEVGLAVAIQHPSAHAGHGVLVLLCWSPGHSEHNLQGHLQLFSDMDMGVHRRVADDHVGDVGLRGCRGSAGQVSRVVDLEHHVLRALNLPRAQKDHVGMLGHKAHQLLGVPTEGEVLQASDLLDELPMPHMTGQPHAVPPSPQRQREGKERLHIPTGAHDQNHHIQRRDLSH